MVTFLLTTIRRGRGKINIAGTDYSARANQNATRSAPRASSIKSAGNQPKGTEDQCPGDCLCTGQSATGETAEN